ncbi:MAG TPA: iron-sulfur protein [Clostridiales bacterium]|nr:iron-sulfur protein [Clostridiales bacterium]
MKALNQVSIVKCENYERERVVEAVKKSFDLIGGIGKFIKPGMKVALKPNLLTRKSPESAAAIHPEVVYAVGKLVKEAGADVKVVESPGGPYSVAMLKAVYSGCGITQIAQDAEIELNYDTSIIDVDNPKGLYLKKITVLKPLTEADFIIDLPKLKTHGQMLYTGAVKNMFGAIPGTQKAEYHLRMHHYKDFANTLIDIFLSVKPGLVLMDGITAMEGMGPSNGTPRDLGLIFASDNAFDLDLVASTLINIKPEHIPVLNQGMERGLCKTDVDQIKIVGEDLKSQIVYDFETPPYDSLNRLDFTQKSIFGKAFKIFTPKPRFHLDQCIGCGICARSCPPKVIKMENKLPQVNLDNCIRCFCCQELCPEGAIDIKRSILAGQFLNGKKVNR